MLVRSRRKIFSSGTTRARAKDACLIKLFHSFMLHTLTVAPLLPLSSRSHTKKCWCAAEVDLRHGDGTCDMACTGNAGTTCGGFDAFDLFELESLPPSEDHYLGCFADDKRDRVLGDKTSSGNMSLQVKAVSRTAFAGATHPNVDLVAL